MFVYIMQAVVYVPLYFVYHAMRIKPSVYEDMWIYYIINVVNLIHAPVTFCGHLQGGVTWRIYYKDIRTSAQNIKF